ncbi:Hypothetical protein PBC10988_2400 [Planctomycetales bacterium 10988]|nr:Hypothetical protein PBC10988_2400 [Planctomycetales bacterium 10988]
MSKTMYDWTRFWHPIGEPPRFYDSGSLIEPESDRGRYEGQHLKPLSEYSHCPCLILLGEPGSGKTTEFRQEVHRRTEAAEKIGGSVIDISLNEYGTDVSLRSAILNHESLATWRNSERTLHLLLDSLDEGQLGIENLSQVLRSILKELKTGIDRLRLLITCRTAEWPQTLQNAIHEMWDKNNVKTLQIAPLRRSDIEIAAKENSVEPDRFVKNLIEKRAACFATNPITLNLLLKRNQKPEDFPETETEIYEQGCLDLCTELSEERGARKNGIGEVSFAQRLEIASKIAAYAVFCNKSIIDTSRQCVSGSDHLTMSELARDTEILDGVCFSVSEQAVREALSTGIFVGRGANQLTFLHRTFAEFLAARYLQRRELSSEQIESLIFHPEMEGKLVPQLSETIARLATNNSRLTTKILAIDPELLLRSDVFSFDEKSKYTLVEKLLQQFETEETSFSRFSRDLSYQRLRTWGQNHFLSCL